MHHQNVSPVRHWLTPFLEYICGHRLNLSQVTHTNCMGIPAGQRQCSNMTALPQILNSRRECRVCTTLRAGEINEANTPTPAPTSAPVTPPSNVRGSIPYRSGSSCDIVRPRPIKIRLTLDKVLRVPAAKETDEKLEAEEIEEDWETVSKKEVEGMAGKDEDWVMA